MQLSAIVSVHAPVAVHHVHDIKDCCPEAIVCFRDTIIAGKDRMLIALDYHQIEMRTIAHLSKDKALAADLCVGPTAAGGPKPDIFKNMASSIYGIPVAEITYTQRQRAKGICYGMCYGMGYATLAFGQGMSEKDAKVRCISTV